MLSVFGSLSHMLLQLKYVKLDDPKSCERIFKSNQSLGMLVLIGILLDLSHQGTLTALISAE